MKYSLAENAASSLHIALEHFKAFYYNSDEIPMSILDENIKISLSFLENAIELLLKTVLVVDDETSIYVEPNCKTIKKAMKKRSKQIALSDVLIKEVDGYDVGSDRPVPADHWRFELGVCGPVPVRPGGLRLRRVG